MYVTLIILDNDNKQTVSNIVSILENKTVQKELPGIEYYRRKKVYKEKIFAENEDMRACTTTKQQNDYANTDALKTIDMKFCHHPI